MNDKVLVIIPMHGFPELTEECVDNVVRNAGIDCKILVVDDCSEKPFGWRDPARYEENSNFAILRLKKHSGFTKAVNAGLRALKLNYDFVCILNNDTIPQKDFLKSMVETAKLDPQIGIVGAGRISNWDPYTVAMWGTDLTTGMVAVSHEDFTEASQCIWIPFCCVLFTKNLVQTIGLLDEKMVNHCSDNDYCLRALFMDFCVVHDPNAKVFHYQSVTVHSLDIEPYEDQTVFTRKWFGVAMNEILSKIPINETLNKWGELGFKYETKKSEFLKV